MKCSGVCLVTKSVPAMVAYYSNILGCQAEGDSNHAELHIEGCGLTIFSWQGMEEMAPGSMRGAGSGAVTLAFEVEDVDAEFVRLQALGVAFVKLPATYPWKARSFWFRDPDGNIVDFYSRVEG
jgi:catechol 2,3-dioxygenase-like lactoylglutathione lyase family enzyme